MSAKKWTLSFVALCLAIMALMMGIIYIYDPFCYYRIPENRGIVNNYRFVNAGIAKNADYDAAIIGSSMTQNFRMDSFREKLGVNPVKLTVGGMSVEGMELTYNLVKEIDKAKTIYVCVDLPSLNKEEDALETYATYLYNASVADDYKYLLGYEAWARLLPINIAFQTIEKMGKKLPSSYVCHNIDTIGEWHSTAKYGKDRVIKAYLDGGSGVSEQKREGAYERIVKNIDKIIEIICGDEEKNVVFFLPPYSALYWVEVMECGVFEANMTAKEYLLKALENKSNVVVYDFQTMPIINDLDNYKDITHYSADINENMVDCFASGEYLVTAANITENNNLLRQMVAEFRKENEDWLSN